MRDWVHLELVGCRVNVRRGEVAAHVEQLVGRVELVGQEAEEENMYSK